MALAPFAVPYVIWNGGAVTTLLMGSGVPGKICFILGKPFIFYEE